MPFGCGRGHPMGQWGWGVLMDVHKAPIHWAFNHLPGPVPDQLGCR